MGLYGNIMLFCKKTLCYMVYHGCIGRHKQSGFTITPLILLHTNTQKKWLNLQYYTMDASAWCDQHCSSINTIQETMSSLKSRNVMFFFSIIFGRPIRISIRVSTLHIQPIHNVHKNSIPYHYKAVPPRIPQICLLVYIHAKKTLSVYQKPDCQYSYIIYNSIKPTLLYHKSAVSSYTFEKHNHL